MKCEGWCLPAVIYIVLAVISLILALLRDLTHLEKAQADQVRLITLLFHVGWVIIWTCVLYWLCANCHQGWAWVILFLPFFIGLVVLVFGSALIVAFAAGRAATKGVKAVGHGVEHAAETGHKMVEAFNDDDE